MKRIIFIVVAAVAMTAVFKGEAVRAGAPVTKTAKLAVKQEMFMDMAVTAAKTEKARKGEPCGAVVIANNAWKSTGVASGARTAEQDAIAKSRQPNLKGAVMFTVNEPTTDAYNQICKAGFERVYFCNPREAVIAAGIYPASAYDDSRIAADVTLVPMVQVALEEAADLLK